jgi:hypothetical protein
MTLRSDGEKKKRPPYVLMDDVIMGSRDNTISQKKRAEKCERAPLSLSLVKTPSLSLP